MVRYLVLKPKKLFRKLKVFIFKNILSNGQLTVIPKTSARINDFWITYTNKKTISQFYSDISILDSEGSETSRKTIYVNYPLIHKGISYYQTDWNLIGLRFQDLENKIIEYPLTNILNNQSKVWLTWISNNQSLTTGIIAIIDNLEGYCSIYNETGQFIGNIELNEIINLTQPLTFLEIISSTGLQIKADPGIPIIYTGFLFLMLSTLISYITYSQIWIIKKDQKVFLGGNTNRATFEFELEFFKLVK